LGEGPIIYGWCEIMSKKGTHYERAFKAYLGRLRLPFVAVDQARKAVFGGVHLKSFDFLIYPPQQRRILTDVKGRKLAYSEFQRGRLGESWATRDDVEGLKSWQEVFGCDYLAVLVFAYWLYQDGQGGPEIKSKPEQVESMCEMSARLGELFSFEQRLYTFRVVELNAYSVGMKPRSTSWQTVYVPRRIFREVALPFESFFRTTRRCV